MTSLPPTFRTLRHGLGALGIALLVSACTLPDTAPLASLTQQTQSLATATNTAATAVFEQAIDAGLYELTLLDGKLYVASAGPQRLNNEPGTLYVLDPNTLTTLQRWTVPLQAYSLRADTRAKVLYTGHTVDGAISAINNQGQVLHTFRLSKPSRHGQYLSTRKLVLDEAGQRLFVAHPGQRGKVWVVDTRTAQVQHTIELERMMAFGMAYDPATDRLYVSHAQGIAEIDPTQGTVLRQLALESDQNILLNVALDTAGKRLFVTDTKKGELQVWHLNQPSRITRIAIGPGVLDLDFDAQRNEIYVTHRGVTREAPLLGNGQLSIVDATDYRIKHRIPLKGLPNSVIVDPESEALYISVKQPDSPAHPSYRQDGLESIVRIDLRSLP